MKYRFLILTILCSLLLAGCKNSFLQKDSSEFVKVTITLNDNSRKLAPDSNKLNDFFSKLTYTLKVGDATEEITLNDCYDGTYSCEVQTGTYDLVLNAYDGSALIFSDRKEKVNLQEDVLLTFDLKITEDSAPGCLSYYFSPEDFGRLNDIDLEAISNFTLTLNGVDYTPDKDSVIYKEEKDCYYFEIAELPAGAYSMTVEYTFEGEDYKIKEAVLIYPGFETTNDGNEFYYSKVYTITYHTDADIQNFCADDENFPKKYNPNDFNGIGSPLTDEAADEYIFLGWYYDEDFTKPLYKYYENGEELYNFGEDTKAAGNIVLYSKIKRAVEIEYVVLDSEGNSLNCELEDFEDAETDYGFYYQRYVSKINSNTINNIFEFGKYNEMVEVEIPPARGGWDPDYVYYYVLDWYYDEDCTIPVNTFYDTDEKSQGNGMLILDKEAFFNKVENNTEVTLYGKALPERWVTVHYEGGEFGYSYQLEPILDGSGEIYFTYNFPCSYSNFIYIYYEDKDYSKMIPYDYDNYIFECKYSKDSFPEKDVDIYCKQFTLNNGDSVFTYKYVGKDGEIISTDFKYNEIQLGEYIYLRDTPLLDDGVSFVKWYYDEDFKNELPTLEYNIQYIILTPELVCTELEIYPKTLSNVKITYNLPDDVTISDSDDITDEIKNKYANIENDFESASYICEFNIEFPIVDLPLISAGYEDKYFEGWYKDSKFTEKGTIGETFSGPALIYDENNFEKNDFDLYARFTYPVKIEVTNYNNDSISKWLAKDSEEDPAKKNEQLFSDLTANKILPTRQFVLPVFDEADFEDWYISTENPEVYKDNMNVYFEEHAEKFLMNDDSKYRIPSKYFSESNNNVILYITPKFVDGTNNTLAALYEYIDSPYDTSSIWLTGSNSVNGGKKCYTYKEDFVITEDNELYYYSDDGDKGIYSYNSDDPIVNLGNEDNVKLFYEQSKKYLWYSYEDISGNYYLNYYDTINNQFGIPIEAGDKYIQTFAVDSEKELIYFITDVDGYHNTEDFMLTIIDMDGTKEQYYLPLWLLGKDVDDGNHGRLTINDMYINKTDLYILFNSEAHPVGQSRGGIIKYDLTTNKMQRHIIGWRDTPVIKEFYGGETKNYTYYYPETAESEEYLFGPRKIIGYVKKGEDLCLLISDTGAIFIPGTKTSDYFKEVNRVIEFDLETNEIEFVKQVDGIHFNSLNGCIYDSYEEQF